MLAAMRAYIWRLGFVGTIDGQEVEVGPRYASADVPPPRQVEAMIPLGGTGIVEEIERPVIVHEEIEQPIFMEEDAHGEETAIDPVEVEMVDIPLVSSIGVSGGPSTYGFRTGGRRRATMRGGGSRSSEDAVDRALEWLRRHQEADGSWGAGEQADLRPAATGLAILAFLGAGNTEKHANPKKFQKTVRKAVQWLIAQQRGDGRIGDDTGIAHAIGR